ncbi:MAG: SDR family NAD(P)-dependent oxidoreductase [Lachnospiraceae bacterium]|nr:SDR family NAD(P)-dependent oxidoreductase [Lachnospiraceae bacterium]
METDIRQIALISGASRGIGRAIAGQLAADGYDLRLCCRQNIDLLKQTALALQAQYAVNITVCCGDLADPSFCTGLMKDLPRLDLLINNAGISHIGLLQDMSDREWHGILDTNLSSVFLLCRAAIPLMLREHHGRIINISSVWGSVGASMEAAYSAAKGGVDAMTKALAKELAPSNIAVNAIAPGFIDTEMNAHLSAEEKEMLLAEIPAGRAGTPAEVASFVSLLAKAPSYLTGQIIRFDGGWC